ncbi:hypothetical protein [Nostoc sp. T09]|nr:hypothetical protein [Nostoc sp. T09]
MIQCNLGDLGVDTKWLVARHRLAVKKVTKRATVVLTNSIL